MPRRHTLEAPQGTVPSALYRRRRPEVGATSTEYGLLVLFIALAIVLGVTAFGGAIDNWYDRLATAVGAL